MPQTETVICYMRSGYAQTFGRLRGCPKIPGQPEKVDLEPTALKYLRSVGNAFIELTSAQFKTFEADQKEIAEARDKRRAEREAKKKDVGPRETKSERRKRKAAEAKAAETRHGDHRAKLAKGDKGDKGGPKD